MTRSMGLNAVEAGRARTIAQDLAADAWGADGDGRDFKVDEGADGVIVTENTLRFCTAGITVGENAVMEDVVSHDADPEAILIAAEEGDVEAALCALGTDPMVCGVCLATEVAGGIGDAIAAHAEVA